MAAGATTAAAALMAWARSGGVPVTVQTVVRPDYDPGNPASSAPVATDWPLQGMVAAGGVVQTPTGGVATRPRVTIAVDDMPLGLGTSSRVRLAPSGPLLQVQAVRVRRVAGTDALAVLELEG